MYEFFLLKMKAKRTNAELSEDTETNTTMRS